MLAATCNGFNLAVSVGGDYLADDYLIPVVPAGNLALGFDVVWEAGKSLKVSTRNSTRPPPMVNRSSLEAQSGVKYGWTKSTKAVALSLESRL